MTATTLFFCVGVTKAGTTWLHDYLLTHQDCYLRRPKEVHYFDTLRQHEDNRLWQSRVERLERLTGRLRWYKPWRYRRSRSEIRNLKDWVTLFRNADADHAAYLSYLNQGRGTERLIGDVTTAYCLLDRTVFAQMNNLMPDVRFIYLLRDPIDRAWSQARMIARLRNKRNEHMGSTPLRVVQRMIGGKERELARRSDYERTLTELTAAIPPERLGIFFFEDLFCEPTLRKLTDFLGIEYSPAEFDRIVHEGSPDKLTPEAHRGLAAALHRQYEYCNAYFDGGLPDRWRKHMLEI